MGQPWASLTVHPNGEMEARDSGCLGPEGFENALRVVGLNPGAEEPGQHRQMRQFVDDLFKFEPGEPGIEDVFTDCRAKPGPHALEQFAPGFLVIAEVHVTAAAFSAFTPAHAQTTAACACRHCSVAPCRRRSGALRRAAAAWKNRPPKRQTGPLQS